MARQLLLLQALLLSVVVAGAAVTAFVVTRDREQATVRDKVLNLAESVAVNPFVVEAAASGLPAVVASVGAAHEHVVDGETGIVANGAPALACAISALLGDPQRRARMATAARERARGYDLEAAVAATWSIYRDVAAIARAKVAS